MKKQSSLNHIFFKRAGLFDVYHLALVFEEAINSDYAFYSIKIREVIKKRYDFLSLLKAWLNPHKYLFCLKTNDKYVGMLVGVNGPEGVAVINWLYIKKKFRNKGYAKLLIEKSEEVFAQNGNHKVTVTTEIAPNFYRRINYQEDCRLTNHWWGKDFYLFSKELRKN